MGDKKANIIVSLVDKATPNLKGLSGFLKKHFVITAGDMVNAFKSVSGVISDFVTEAATAEKSQNALASAMKNNGVYTKAAHDDLKTFNSELQKNTAYEDDAIANAQSLLVSLGKLSGDGLKKATQATLDMSARLGIDLDSAASLVGKTLGSSTNALARYGVQIEGAAGSTERLNSFVEKSAELFGGAAASQAETFAGKTAQINNQIGDLKETIGGGLLPVLGVFQNSMKDLTTQANGFFSSEKGKKWTENLSYGLIVMKSTLGVLGIGFKSFFMMMDANIKAWQIGWEKLAYAAESSVLKIKGVFTKNTGEQLKLASDHAKKIAELENGKLEAREYVETALKKNAENTLKDLLALKKKFDGEEEKSHTKTESKKTQVTKTETGNRSNIKKTEKTQSEITDDAIVKSLQNSNFQKVKSSQAAAKGTERAFSAAAEGASQAAINEANKVDLRYKELYASGYKYALDFDGQLKSLIQDSFVSPDGIMKNVTSGLQSMFGDVGTFVSGATSGLLTGIIGWGLEGALSVLKDQPVYRNLTEEAEQAFSKMIKNTNEELDKIRKEKDIEEQKIDLLQELLKKQGLGGIVGAQYTEQLGVEKGTTIKEALTAAYESLKGLNKAEIAKINSDIAKAQAEIDWIESARKGDLGKEARLKVINEDLYTKSRGLSLLIEELQSRLTPTTLDVSIKNLRLADEIKELLGSTENVGTQANGGTYVANKPTLAVFGEAGPERATFTPLSRGGGSGQPIVVVVQIDKKEVGRAVVEYQKLKAQGLIS